MERCTKISVVTACFNSERTIGDSIASLKRQSWPHVQHVVIDGASKDDTVAVARKTLAEGDVLVSEPDKGIYDALNKGIQNSTGDVVGFLHSDDFFAHEHVLAKVAACFDDPSIGAVYGDLEYVGAQDPKKVVRQWRSGAFSTGKLRCGWMPPHPTFFMRRSFYEELGGFDLSYRIAGDYDSLLRYLSDDRLFTTYLPEVLVKMRVGGASNRSIRQMIIKSLEDARAMRANGVNPLIALPYKNFSKIPQFLGALNAAKPTQS